MNISELGQYTSKLLKILTDDRKVIKLRDIFGIVLNLVINSYQDLISILQRSEKMIREMAYQFLQNKLSAKNIRAKAYALALLALNANTRYS
ncbi:hypothetical protein F8M41_026506 [Gigaspora margarita]|uniref:Uncharacterized protein n=1 Tax=Gigaspora margarita TaxID=4874 RepID=A0A8H3XIB1_GIGMA|nr:hypothetical protein F8M41_026506 [Gigaspora margarita]